MSHLLRSLGLLAISNLNRLVPALTALPATSTNQFHTSSTLSKKWNGHSTGPKRWLEYNKIIYPPQEAEEKPRPAFVCHQKTNIKYSPKKMWYIASFVRGMSVDEAIKQLSFIDKKGATTVKEAILEAVELAVKRHNVEFRSNLWVAESFCGKGRVFKGFRRHGRGRFGEVEYKHSHYFVRLEEGSPPENYYPGQEQKSGDQMLQEWLESMRKRKVIHSL